MLQQHGRGEKLPDEICYSASWRKITQEIPSAYQTQRLALMVCSDRISLLLKSSLTHYVFLQRGRKGPQRTKYGKSDIIMQVPTERRVLVHASFCFCSELNLCKDLCFHCNWQLLHLLWFYILLYQKDSICFLYFILFCPSVLFLLESNL